jgi:hypothetical protein
MDKADTNADSVYEQHNLAADVILGQSRSAAASRMSVHVLKPLVVSAIARVEVIAGDSGSPRG